MRTGCVRRRGGRAVLALLVGLLVGGWAGFGLTYLLKRSQFPAGLSVADVTLAKADELELVPADAAGFVHLRAADLWRADALADLRRVVEKAGPDALKALDDFVPSPATFDRLTVVVLKPAAPAPRDGPPNFGGVPPNFGGPMPFGLGVLDRSPVVAVLAFSAPIDADRFLKANLPDAVRQKAGTKEYWDHGSGVSAFFPSDRVVVLGNRDGMAAYMKAPVPADGPLAPALKLAAAGGRHVVAGVNLAHGGLKDELRRLLPPEAAPVLTADGMAFGMILGAGAKMDLRLAYKDGPAADAAERAVRKAAEDGRRALAEAKTKAEAGLKGRPGQPTPRPAEQMPAAVGGVFAVGAIAMADEWLAGLPLTRDGNELAVAVTMPSLGAAYLTAAGASVGMLLPAVQKVREAAARTQDSNKLKQIGIAFHNYHDTMGKLPPPDWGQPQPGRGNFVGKLSWRVALLPYLEQDTLYRQFKLDEPWDSDHNKKLIPLMPKVYVSPLAVAEPGKTYYKVFVGGGAAFAAGREARFPASFPDGTSNTILVAEGGEAVTWTKPDDFAFDPARPLPDLSLLGNRIINVLLADGSTRSVNLDAVSPATIKLAIQAADGMPLPADW